MIEPSDFTNLEEFEKYLPIAELLAVLRDPMARVAVYYICQESRVSLDHLADVVTGWTNASSGTLASSDDRE
jgi:hypothetical protein